MKPIWISWKRKSRKLKPWFRPIKVWETRLFCFVKNIFYKMEDIYCKIENIVYNKAIKTRKENHVAKNLKLKMARVEHDMTQGDLADAIGVTRQTIGLIEAGKYNPTLSLCLAICKTLDKTLDQLFWE